MKKTLLTLVLILFFFNSFSQQSPAFAIDYLDVNDVGVAFGTRSFCWDLSNANYFVPANSGLSTIFAHEYWMGGLDASGELHLAAMTYRQSGNDYWAGPCSDIVYHNDEDMSQWDRVWKINKSEIDQHITDFAIAAYEMPEAIENWPAHGNPALGQSYNLAPFIDVDADEIYNPSNGDYPCIQGDQAIYIIRNDIGNVHTETTTYEFTFDNNGIPISVDSSYVEPIGVEQHLMFYAFDDPSGQALDKTIFVNMRIINRSEIDYQEFNLGLFTDPDIGNFDDDYVGCHVGLNLAYAYNGDDNDEGNNGYGTNPPAQGLVSLDQELTSFMYFNNNNTESGNPSGSQSFYNYMKASWKDGLPLTFGGDGRYGATPTRYMFPGNSDSLGVGTDGQITYQDWDTPEGWTEETAGNSPADRRFIQSIGPLEFDAGETIEFNYAFVYGRGQTGAYSSVQDLFKNTRTIINFYDDNIVNCEINHSTDLENVASISGVQVFPNPFSDQATIKFNNDQNITHEVSIVDVSGRMIRTYVPTKENYIRIQKGNLAPGLYFIRLINENSKKEIPVMIN